MRVLHVIPSLSPRHGGPTFAVRGMARAAAALGIDVTVAATTADGAGELDVPLEQPLVEDGVRYFYFRRQRPRGWSLSLPLAAWIRRSVGHYDVLHVHSLFSFPTLVAADAARRANVPYVLRPLGSLDPWSLDRGRWKKRLYISLVERRNLERAAAVHATSERERQAIRRWSPGISPAVLPIGIDTCTPAACGGNAHAPRHPIRFLFLSRLHEKKGLDTLFDALSRLVDVDWHLDVAGDGDPRYVAGLKEQVDRRGYAPRVAFRGFVTGSDKQTLLEQADIFVLPSRDENFGLAVAEAMAAGLPVVVSTDVAIADDIVAHGAGVAVSQDASELADALDRLTRNEGLRRRMSDRASTFAREVFSWTVIAPQLVALYERVCASS